MKIAFFINDFPSISETFILNQIVGLLQRGHQVDIHARSSSRPLGNSHADISRYHLSNRVICDAPTPGPWMDRIRSASARIFQWGSHRPATILDSLNFFRYGRRALNLSILHERLPADRIVRKYDAIHGHFGPNGQRAVALRNLGAISGPLISTFHGYDVNLLPRLHGPKLYLDLFKEGAIFTVGSDFIKKRIIQLGAPEQKIVKIPMGVSVNRFLFVERSRAKGEELRLLTIARLVEVKGIQYALHAIATIKDKIRGLRYRIVGDGPLRENLQSLTSKLGLEDIVSFLGEQPEDSVIQQYEWAHIFILPSIVTESGEEESQAVVLAEAQASGLPVIATATGGIPESVIDGATGLLVPPKDSEALAASIIWLFNHPEAWAPMGRSGRSHIEHNFDLETLNDKLIKIYRSLNPQLHSN
jgi:colanic acid/amylovoran biosynthesis glycosyltransferase